MQILCSGVVERFKAVIGTILTIRMPLLISALERLADPRSATDIHAVLRGVQSIIIVNKETPQVYHKSLSCQRSSGINTGSALEEDRYIELLPSGINTG
jgi:hypothetical protein